MTLIFPKPAVSSWNTRLESHCIHPEDRLMLYHITTKHNSTSASGNKFLRSTFDMPCQLIHKKKHNNNFNETEQRAGAVRDKYPPRVHFVSTQHITHTKKCLNGRFVIRPFFASARVLVCETHLNRIRQIWRSCQDGKHERLASLCAPKSLNSQHLQIPHVATGCLCYNLTPCQSQLGQNYPHFLLGKTLRRHICAQTKHNPP